MRIEGLRQTNKAGKKKGSDKANSGGERFRVGPGAAAGGLSGTQGAQSISHIGALLAVQEVEANSDRSGPVTRQLQRGNEMLDRLDQLKLGLLSGRVSPQNLQKLRRLSSEKPMLEGHEGLSKVMQSIELRAEVELAKLAQKKLR